ncbi:MAG: sigma-70 family RNA polymerase sigma factor [Spirochaetes bacterium]|nr:sigma-70 family RNA polymerase sigma factor [Spirochaetota bacterium]
MERASEELLVLSAQTGNSKAFNILFKCYNSSLLRFALKICNDSTLAAEAVQEAWINCARNLKKLQDPRAFRSWMYQLVRWRAIDQIRKIRLKQIPFDEAGTDQNDFNSQKSTIDNEDLKSLINQLPAIDQQAIYLFYYEEMKISEIAVVLKIPSGTVKSRLNRARNTLKNKLELNQEFKNEH